MPDMTIEVAYALPEKQYLQKVTLEEGCTVEQAIVAGPAGRVVVLHENRGLMPAEVAEPMRGVPGEIELVGGHDPTIRVVPASAARIGSVLWVDRP